MDDNKKTKKDLTKELASAHRRLKALEKKVAAGEASVKRARERNRKLTKSLSDLRETQRKTIQRERLHALGEMASGIVHDFNNSLTPILGATDFLLMNPHVLDKKEEVTLLLESARTAARDARDMVRRLRDFYRLEDDTIAEPIDVNPLVEQVVLLTQPKWQKEAQAKGAEIAVMTDVNPVALVTIGESHLREVLTNLVLNAVDAMPDGGTITLGTGMKGKEVVVTVADTGNGMSDEVLERCFEPFFSTKGREGTGMGLAMAYGVIRGYDGAIDVTSEKGVGTVITIRLHAGKGSGKGARAEPVPTRESIPKLRVLVVDDNLLSCGIITKCLSADGHSVKTAADGDEALHYLSVEPYDLVVLDKIMPSIKGEPLPRAVKKAAPYVPLIQLTGSGDLHERSAHAGDIDLVVGKPLTQLELRQAIIQVLRAQKAKKA